MRNFRWSERKILSGCCLFFGTALFLIAATSIFSYIRDGKISDDGNNRAASMINHEVTMTDLTNKQCAILPEDEMDIAAMQEVNPDTVGYLKIQNKEFPVVKAADSKYMKTGWDGKKTAYGCIFMDGYCDLNGKNIILYGHHMKNGKMFGSLDKYLSKEYRNENPTFKWITKDYVDTYTVIALIKTKATDIADILDMDLKSDMEKLSEKAKKTNTLYGEFHTGKSYMSLVTCEYTMKNGRLVVIGERVNHVKR